MFVTGSASTAKRYDYKREGTTLKKCLKLLTLVLCALLTFTGCGSRDENDDPQPALSSSSIELRLGETSVLTVENYRGDVIWSSSDDAIASVSQTGEISANALGNAAVTAKIDGDKSMSCVVSVKKGESSVTSISVTSYYSSSSDITLNYQDSPSALLKATASGAQPGEMIIWQSENESVARVDQNGNVTALANGTTTITATALNGIYGACTIRVKNAPEAAEPEVAATDFSEVIYEENAPVEEQPPVEDEIKLPVSLPTAQSSIVISDVQLYLNVAEDKQLNVTLSNAPEGTYVNWDTSNKAVAVVKYGRVVAVGEGICMISAVTTDGAATGCYVAVGKKAKKELQEMLSR